MKHKNFYLYQSADIIFTSSCRAIGMLLAWVMIQHYQLKIELGWFISISWLLQVLTLIFMGLFSNRFRKKTVPVFCSAASFLCLITLEFGGSVEPLQLGLIYIATSLFSIAIQPIGSSIIPNLYTGKDIERAFRIRGFVNSINTILGAAISGFVISAFSAEQTIRILIVSIGVSCLAFIIVKTNELSFKNPNHKSLSAIKALAINNVERVMVTVSAMSNFILTPTLMYITPILIIDRYGYTALEIGLSEAMFGIGMFLGSALFCKKLNNVFGVRITTVFSIATVGASLLLILIADNIYSLFLGLLFAGAGVVIYNINTTKIRCSATPADLRSSFESIFLAVCILPIPAGVAISTLMVDSGKLELSLTLFSMLIFASALAVWLSKDFRLIAQLDNDDLDSHYIKLYPKAYL
ncbi:MFS transporter [Xenorhabdus eapokensis]|uniref:Membrane protein n=1 Tax=Xenorhabdus eapokensis TaxID=1873482 RepID=A0A1Q5TIY9_9GAMM|nr:MFS transporter [Xenorhabdus eapokensis]OKP00181.1 membrane protein [Xenorhabdus eapokensis]